MTISKSQANTRTVDPVTGDAANVGTKSDGTTKGIEVIAEVTGFTAGNSPKNFIYEIQRGDHPNLTIKTIFGHNDAIKNTVEAIWHQQGDIAFPSSAAPLDVQSTSANDTSAGTGGRTLRIIGLDTNWDIITEDVTLNGTTTVTTTASFLRINEAFLLTAGSTTYNEGDITFDISATTYENIGAGHSLLHSAKYSIPNNYRGYVFRGAFGAADTTKGIIISAPTINGLTGVRYDTFPIRKVGDAVFNPLEFVPLEAKTDFWVEAKTAGGAGDVEMSASFGLLLEDLS